MPRDVNAYLTAQQANSPPELAEEWAEFEDFYNKRLWHQITLKLLKFVKSPHMQQDEAILNLYENFIAEFENKMNPLSFVEIVACIVQHIKDVPARLQFVEKTKEKVKGTTEAVILCNVIYGQHKLKNENLDDVKKIIEETEALMETLDGVTQVHGRYYQLCSDYHQVMGNHAGYYREALRFLGCTELSDIPHEEQSSRAFTLCLAALLGDGVYNFGELLAHPILDSLKNTEKQWVVDLLYAFNSGSLSKYEALRSAWMQQPDLAAKELALRQKICLLCLMEMTFRRPGNQRVLTFEEIARETQLPLHEVELLVMKALSLGLVRGTIDQVDSKVHMTWVQPRVLDKEQIASMKNRLDAWNMDISSMEKLLETKAQEIVSF
ncbi:26S proteasome non-ATPase regulatory subunit 13-like isoform X2 [Ornithodoros turicata]|uniref:26S proteasome non-ATPase regulatory subunit 13 n=1 Tax=Ornithodoros turicata TaxID=34597 RepID=A0A2R5LL39_9ACAR